MCKNLVVLILIVPLVGAAQDAPEGARPTVATTKRLTGDWLGGRTFLEDRGVTIDLELTTIYQRNAPGDVRTFNAHASILHGEL